MPTYRQWFTCLHWPPQHSTARPTSPAASPPGAPACCRWSLVSQLSGLVLLLLLLPFLPDRVALARRPPLGRAGGAHRQRGRRAALPRTGHRPDGGRGADHGRVRGRHSGPGRRCCWASGPGRGGGRHPARQSAPSCWSASRRRPTSTPTRRARRPRPCRRGLGHRARVGRGDRAVPSLARPHPSGGGDVADPGVAGHVRDAVRRRRGRAQARAAPDAAGTPAARDLRRAIDMAANALYLVAARVGPLSVVVTLSSLYPASTVLLARVVLGERLRRCRSRAWAARWRRCC